MCVGVCTDEDLILFDVAGWLIKAPFEPALNSFLEVVAVTTGWFVKRATRRAIAKNIVNGVSADIGWQAAERARD